MRVRYSIISGLNSLFGPMAARGSELDQRYVREMQSQFIRLILPMAVVNLGNATAVAIAYYGVAHPMKVLGWYAVILFFCALQIYSSLKFRGRKTPEKVSGTLLRKAELTSLVLGALWGSLCFLFASSQELPNMFLNIIIVGMGAGTVAFLGPLCRISVRFLIGSIPLMFMWNFMSGYNYSLATAFLVSMLSVALVIGALRNAFHVREMLKREFDADTARRHMTDAIESTNDAFAFYDSAGALVMANDRHYDLLGEEIDQLSLVEQGNSVETVKYGSKWLMRAQHETRAGGYVVVNTDITALKTRERELVEARKEAVEADAAKGRFLSTMSHELRSPLNVILGFSRLMASDSKVELTQNDVGKYADNIKSSGKHLMQLIDDIIDYSKVGLDRFLLKPKAVDIRALLARTVKLAANYEHVKKMSQIEVLVSPEIGDLWVDENVCQRIIMNLLTNALRFRGVDGRVVIKVGLTAQQTPIIVVRDFGAGISPDELERVFDAFYQIDNGGERKQGGTGLGLTLCRHLARLHDGDVMLKSTLGSGTTAVFVLPKSTLLQGEQEPEDKALQIVYDEQEIKNVA